jgi:hypothetical protein
VPVEIRAFVGRIAGGVITDIPSAHRFAASRIAAKIVSAPITAAGLGNVGVVLLQSRPHAPLDSNRCARQMRDISGDGKRKSSDRETFVFP